MPLISLDRVSLAFGHLPLLADAALRIEPGERVALVGRNGAGKSSLLRVLAGELAVDDGSVWRSPGLRVARLEQDAATVSAGSVRDAVASGLGPAGPAGDAWTRNHRVDEIISRLTLPAERPFKVLSGGWRRRVHLGRALVGAPDLLLLDEPTNHLDIGAIEWLERHLLDYPGALVFVTHDRTFVRRLATRIVELDRGTLRSWPGDYDTYVARKAELLDVEARELERLDRLLEREEAWLRRGIKARRTRNEGRVKDLMALRAERASRRAEVGSVRLAIETAAAPGVTVFEAEHIDKSFGDVTVVRDFSARVVRGDRVGLLGPNGSGKTTLLRLLVGELTPDGGEIRRGERLQVAYFDQQREQLDPERTVVASVADGDTVTLDGQPRHVLGYLADFLFSRERALAPVKSLSGGERNRLLLARLFATPANVLVLDEPTNDLDLETLELLEERIAEFAGTVLLVTHDRAFLDNVVTATWAFREGGRVQAYVGGWADYLRQSAEERIESQPARSRTATGAAPAARPDRAAAPRKRTYNEDREYEALPERIDALEDERRRLQAEAASGEFYKAPPEHIAQVLARIEATGQELDSLLDRWVALESIGS